MVVRGGTSFPPHNSSTCHQLIVTTDSVCFSYPPPTDNSQLPSLAVSKKNDPTLDFERIYHSNKCQQLKLPRISIGIIRIKVVNKIGPLMYHTYATQATLLSEGSASVNLWRRGFASSSIGNSTVSATNS